MDLDGQRTRYIRLFADCVAVRGLRRSAIYDLTRGEVHLFPSTYFRLLEWVCSRTIGEVLDGFEAAHQLGMALDRKIVTQFIDFLLDNELAMICDDPSRFPSLGTVWDFPGQIQNAIIDVDGLLHDFDDLIAQLDQLGCQFLQIRAFSALLSLDVCDDIATRALNTSIKSIELILRYDTTVTLDVLTSFVRRNPIVTDLTIHSAPEDESHAITLATSNAAEEIQRKVTFVRQAIDGERHCGVIATSYLNRPTVPLYSEYRLFNGCLNRKISVDSSGHVRNCPSMGTSFGLAGERRLADVVSNDAFRKLWQINKDKIAVCQSCEFRYICSDCRAYLENPSDQLSKPLKCGYDPATNEWQPWHASAQKQWAIAYYDIPVSSAGDAAGSRRAFRR